MGGFLAELAGLTLVGWLAYVHLVGYKQPDASAVTRALDRYYGMWWEPTRPAFVFMGVMFGLIACLGAVVLVLRISGRL